MLHLYLKKAESTVCLSSGTALLCSVIRVRVVGWNLGFSLRLCLPWSSGDMQKGRFSPWGAAAARGAEHSQQWGCGCEGQVGGWFQGWLRRSHCVPSLSRGCVSWSAEEGDSVPPLSPRTGHSPLQIHFCSDISCMTITFFLFPSFTLGVF